MNKKVNNENHHCVDHSIYLKINSESCFNSYSNVFVLLRKFIYSSLIALPQELKFLAFN